MDKKFAARRTDGQFVTIIPSRNTKVPFLNQESTHNCFNNQKEKKKNSLFYMAHTINWLNYENFLLPYWYERHEFLVARREFDHQPAAPL